MNFCTCEVILVLLAKLKRKLRHREVEKKRGNFCARTWLIFADLVTYMHAHKQFVKVPGQTFTEDLYIHMVCVSKILFVCCACYENN